MAGGSRFDGLLYGGSNRHEVGITQRESHEEHVLSEHKGLHDSRESLSPFVVADVVLPRKNDVLRFGDAPVHLEDPSCSLAFLLFLRRAVVLVGKNEALFVGTLAGLFVKGVVVGGDDFRAGKGLQNRVCHCYCVAVQSLYDRLCELSTSPQPFFENPRLIEVV